MNLTDQERLELNELCGALADGLITEAQRDRLKALLAGSSEARQFYVRAMALSASLFEYAAEMQSEAPESARPSSRFAYLWAWKWALGSVAGVVTLLAAFWLGGQANSNNRDASEPSESVAHLSAAKDCRWSGAPIMSGAGLHRGHILELTAGWAEITFDSGAQVVLSGPVSLQVISAWEAVLRHGSLKASVPSEAVGFRVASAAVDVVDLGTEFSMVADQTGATEVFVLRGAVEARPHSASSPAARSSLVLREKQARRFARNGISEVRNSDLKFQKLSRKIALARATKPTTYIHWSFDDAEVARAAADISGRPASEFDVQLVGSNLRTPSESRGSGHSGSALNCDGELFAKASLPAFAQHVSRTMAFWINVPPDASLVTSEAMLSWVGAPGGETLEFAWNRSPTEGAFGALRTSVGRNFILGTTPLRDGQWHHIAIVLAHHPHTPQKLQIKQYVDGRLDTVSARHVAKRIGSGQPAQEKFLSTKNETLWIGRSPNGTGQHSFRGMIDELYIVDRALAQKEIRMLMGQNRLPTPAVLGAD